MKGFDMKKNVFFVLLIVATFWLSFCENHATAKALDKEALLEAASNLMEAEVQYHQVRVKSEWEKIYGFQTAGYRKKIPIEEFIYTGGKKRPDWKEKIKERQSINLSGARFKPPTMKEMYTKIKKKPKYKIIGGEGGSFTGRASTYTYGEEVQISPDGKYGRVTMVVDVLWLWVEVWIQPLPMPEFWDFENGGWHVQLNRWDFLPISGMRKPPGPDIQYKTVPLREIIDYHLNKANKLYHAGKREEAMKEYLRAVELRPLQTYKKAPMDDPEVKAYLKNVVFQKIEEWNRYLRDRSIADSFAVSYDTWSKEKLAAKRAELEKIKKDFTK